MATKSDTYAIIAVGGKQYRVREGQWLLVDRLPYDEGKTFHPDVLLVGGDGEAKLGDGELKGQQVTLRVAGHELGDKIVVGKHRRRTGYRRRKGHRSRLTRIAVESIGKKTTRSKAESAQKPAAEKKAASGEKKPAARKPAARKTTKETK